MEKYKISMGNFKWKDCSQLEISSKVVANTTLINKEDALLGKVMNWIYNTTKYVLTKSDLKKVFIHGCCTWKKGEYIIISTKIQDDYGDSIMISIKKMEPSTVEYELEKIDIC